MAALVVNSNFHIHLHKTIFEQASNSSDVPYDLICLAQASIWPYVWVFKTLIFSNLYFLNKWSGEIKPNYSLLIVLRQGTVCRGRPLGFYSDHFIFFLHFFTLKQLSFPKTFLWSTHMPKLSNLWKNCMKQHETAWNSMKQLEQPRKTVLALPLSSHLYWGTPRIISWRFHVIIFIFGWDIGICCHGKKTWHTN